MELRSILRFAVAAVAGIAALVTTVAMPGEAAHACSCPGCDPIELSPVIIGGTVTDWWPAISQPPAEAAFQPIFVAVHVDEVYRGQVGSDAAVLDTGSYFFDGAQYSWRGAGGSCGIFDTEPGGQHLIVGLIPRADGSFTSDRIRLFFAGDTPSGPAYEQAAAHLGSLIPYPPNTGTAPPETPSTGPSPLFLATVIIASSVLLALVLILGLSDHEKR